MANKHVERCSTLDALREVHIKTWRCVCPPAVNAAGRRCQVLSGLSLCAGGSAGWCWRQGRQRGGLSQN